MLSFVYCTIFGYVMLFYSEDFIIHRYFKEVARKVDSRGRWRLRRIPVYWHESPRVPTIYFV